MPNTQNSTQYPLVSIIIITYNSSRYILETLESAKSQTYLNIELIVSDDYSTDNTIGIIESWLANNSGYFVDTRIIQSNINTGISGNCNRGVLNSKGKYLKMIAGDDILANNCVQDYISFFQANENIQIAASKTKIFFNGDINHFIIWPKKGEFPSELKKQQTEILKANFVYNVSIFFTRELYDKVGGFDESYPMIEDYPFDYKVLKYGFKFYLMDNISVYYRVNHDSTSRPANQGNFVNIKSYTDAYNFINNVILKELLEQKMYFWYFLRKSKIDLTRKIVENGNSAIKNANFLSHKLLFINKFVSNKLRKIRN